LSHAGPYAFTAGGLRHNARALHQPRILLWNVGWICVIAALGLSVLGIVAIGTTEEHFAMRQIAHLCIAFIAAAVMAMPHYRWLQRFSYPFMILALGLLLFVLVPGVPESIVRPRGGARRWIDLGVTDFQPSEVAKIAYIIALANYLRLRHNYRTFFGLLLPMALSFVPMGLILIEPNLGMTMLFLPTLFAMLVAAGAKIKHIMLIVVLGLSIAPLSYPMLRPHQKDRIDALLAQVKGDPRHEEDIGYQGARAMTLVGAGGLIGVGQDKAADLIEYNHLPEEHNDMVFAVVCCRWGMLGGVFLWLLFGVFCVGGVLTAGLCKDPFGRLVAVGIIASMFAQMTINTGMTIGLLPITGLPLPFVSYGGSSMVATWMMVGLLLNIAMRRAKYMSRQSFEFDSG
jgi:cell division protein FtsW (lipid II flippase)